MKIKNNCKNAKISLKNNEIYKNIFAYPILPPPDFLSSKMTYFNKLLKLYKPCQKVGVVEFQLNHIKKAGAKAPANCEKASALSNNTNHMYKRGTTLVVPSVTRDTRQSSRKRANQASACSSASMLADKQKRRFA